MMATVIVLLPSRARSPYTDRPSRGSLILGQSLESCYGLAHSELAREVEAWYLDM